MERKRSIGYLWISPDSQKKADQMIDDKQKRLAQYCQNNRVELADFRVDQSISNSILNRPALKQIIDSMNEYDYVIVDSLADIGRRFHDVYLFLNQFQKQQTSFLSLQEEIDTGNDRGQVLLTTLNQIPQLVSWNLIRSTDRRQKRSREARYNGGACPYGYEIDEQTNEYRCMPREAAIVRKIFRERAQGRSLRQIANSLANEGIKTKRGGRWQANTIKTILENMFYTGAYQTQGRIYADDHEPIISEYLFLQVNNQEAQALSL